ncbi:MAG: glycosyl hydrolase 115 family protein [Agathobacter sp.]
MSEFLLTRATEIKTAEELAEKRPVVRAVARFQRDLGMAGCTETFAEGSIRIERQNLPAEAWEISVQPQSVTIAAADELGVIYALNFLSRNWLGITPFWFWNDQNVEKRDVVKIPCGVYKSEKPRVEFRGWFINDEVLLRYWTAGKSNAYVWEMVFEALLRCGGNLVIPGTDKTTKEYTPLAADMGLWITHHHAEPLGAEMFARAYPQLEASYFRYPDLYQKLWQEAIERQKGQKTIFNLGFRGQGDRPFWEDDPSYDTEEKRGALISEIIELQQNMVKSIIPDAKFCTNLYGEIMELYRGGYIHLPKDVILIWADNGYGKMVSRRQGDSNPRVPALPDQLQSKDSHGTYYHVSFYDLQAANHITMLPNSMEFVEKELKEAYDRGIHKLWIINASNIKPHVYPLDFIANLWGSRALDAGTHREQYVRTYYPCNGEQAKELAECLKGYPEATVPYGPNEDDHGGEQFPNYVTRAMIHQWMLDWKTAAKSLNWCCSCDTLSKQISWFKEACSQGQKNFEKLYAQCEKQKDAGGELWRDSVLLQVSIHKECYEGALLFCEAFEKFEKNQLMKSFLLLGNAAERFEAANQRMRDCEHDKWENFYANECLTDVKETAYCLKRLMGYVRNIGDGPDFFRWQREVLCEEEDKRVILITNLDNHMTDWELYEGLKEKQK